MLNLALDNFYYIVNIVTVFTLFLASWLVYDSLKIKFSRQMQLRAIGFALLGFGFIFEQLITYRQASIIICFGLVVFLVGITQEKVNPVPKTKTLNAVSPIFLFFGFILPLVNAVLAAVSSYLLWVRYSKGLVKEYKNLILFFLFLSISMLFSAGFLLGDSENIFISGLSRQHGVLWVVYIFVRGLSLIYLLVYIFNYLRFRVYPMLFSGISTIVVVITILAAVLNSMQMLNSTRNEFTRRLERNIESINLNIEQHKENALASSNLLALNSELVQSLQTSNFEKVLRLSELFALSAESVDFIIITDEKGTVISNSVQPEKVNYNIAGDLLVNRAIAYKEANAGLFLEKSVLNSYIIIKAVSPIFGANQNVVGSIQIAYILDNAYTDRIKSQTGLDIIIFAEKFRSATTFVNDDGVTRLINLEETNQDVIKTVLEEGNNYNGENFVLNVPYFTSYLPIKDPRGIVIGMIFTGEPQSILLTHLYYSNQTIFGISLMLTLFSFIPSKWLADYISKNSK